MSKKIKLFLSLLILIVLLGGIFWGLNHTIWSKNLNEDGNYKVGVILPLSGELASLGESCKNSINLSYGKLSFGQQQKIKLIFEDDQFDPKNTVAAFQKLTEIDQVNLVICFTSGPCGAIAPIAEEKQIPLIAIASNPKIQENKNFIVRLEIAPSQEAKLLLTHLKEKQYQRIASIITLQDGIQAGYTEMKKDAYFQQKEIASETVAPNLKDFHSVIAKLLNSQPAVIFVGLLPGSAGDFARQAKELGYAGKYVGLNFLEGEETLIAAKGALDGIIYTNAQDPEDWFNQVYLKTYKKEKGPGAAHIYDALQLIALGLRRGEVTNQQMTKYLNSIRDYHGALGVFSSTATHEFTLPVILKTISQNEFSSY